ncbi:MAG: hypothetical protein ACI3W5_16180 [Faecousia sp.]
MIRFILLILATLAIALFLYALKKGSDKAALVEGLNEAEYPLKDLYIVGFALNEMKLFRLRGQLERDLKKNTKLILDSIYYEYYTYVTWAQFLTFSLLTFCIGLPLCSMIRGDAGLLMPVILILVIAVIWNMSMSKMKEAVQARRDACLLEFPNMVSKLSLLLTSGMVLRDAWYLIAKSKTGPLYDLMKKSCDLMDNGDSEIVALHKFGILSDSTEIKKFTSAMIQSAEKGNSELATFLIAQVSELWAHKRQLALQQGEIVAGKLIIPIALMFAGIILIVISAALQSMSF